MDDKEIIIDGVDVSGCAYITYRHSENPICSETGQYCKGYDICYYKQLQCKKAECEKLEEKWSIGFQKFCDKDNKLQHYKQALDKIEELASKWYENSIIKYYADYEEILNIISKAKDGKNAN